MRVDDGMGQGYQAGVNKRNQLNTASVNASLQHDASVSFGKAFQVAGTHTVTGAGTSTVLTLLNNSDTDLLVGTYLRPQVASLAGGTFGTATYLSLNFGGRYSSGGTAVTPVNMNKTSGVTAPVTSYGNNPTLTGTLTEFDRWYPEQATDSFVYNKEGTLILGVNDSVTFRFITDHTSGLLRMRMSFYLKEIE